MNFKSFLHAGAKPISFSFPQLGSCPYTNNFLRGWRRLFPIRQVEQNGISSLAFSVLQIKRHYLCWGDTRVQLNDNLALTCHHCRKLRMLFCKAVCHLLGGASSAVLWNKHHWKNKSRPLSFFLGGGEGKGGLFLMWIIELSHLHRLPCSGDSTVRGKWATVGGNE